MRGAFIAVVFLAVMTSMAVAATEPARLIKDIDPVIGSGPNGLTPLGNVVVFDLAGPSNFGFGPGPLWVSDGTEEGTFALTDTIATLAQWPYKAGHLDFFPGEDDAHGLELWRTDGTRAGTYLVHDACPGPASCWPSSAAALGDHLFHEGFDLDHGVEPWISDGTEAGTHLVSDLEQGPTSSFPRVLASDGRRVWFGTPSNASAFRSLWISDGTEPGTKKVKDLTIPANWGSTSFAVSGGRLFFLADDGAHGNGLWVSDGTEAGTVFVKDVGVLRGL